MNVNVPQVSSSEGTSTDSPVVNMGSDKPVINRALRLLVGTVNNRNESLTTVELTEKIKSARVAGIITMALGITLCIVATALVAGVGLPLLPLIPIFVLSLVACLFGVVLTAISSKALSDINLTQMPDGTVGTPTTEERYTNPAFDDSERLPIETPFSETIEGAEAPTKKPAFNEWLELQGLNADPNVVPKKKIKALTVKQIISLTEYDFTGMPTLYQPLIADQIKSLIDSPITSGAKKAQLIEFTKFYLDSIGKNEQGLYSYNVTDCYKLLSPYLGIQKMPRFAVGLNKEKIKPFKILKDNIGKHSELTNECYFDIFSGSHRDVYINKETGIGYKIRKNIQNTHAASLKDNELLNSDDLRLNAIYQNKNFYDGRYKEHANFQLVEILDDYTDRIIEVLIFQKIPNAIPLAPNERIPYSAIHMLENIGYFPYDVAPSNFVKVFNSETNQYDYIPIDARLIGHKRSSSLRTKNIREYKEMNETPYKYMPNIVFTK